jgi:hypothetical protein
MAERRGEPPNVNRVKGNRNSQRGGDFYANGSNPTEEPAQKVGFQPSGAKRDGYFKKRDYY